MPSSSGFSDIHLDRIGTRVNHYVKEDSPTPTSHMRVDSTDFGAIGALFHPLPQRSWPKQIDIPNDHAVSLQADQGDLKPGPPQSPLLTTSSYDGTCSGALPPTPTLTPTQRGPYLPVEELAKLMRNSSRGGKREIRVDRPSDASPTPTRGSSPNTTAYHGTSGWRTPEYLIQIHGSFSPRKTPPPPSVVTTEDDARSAGKGPGSPRPWSEFDRKDNESDKDDTE